MTEVHMDYVQECVKYNRVIIEWVPSKKQVADIMTKPLNYESHTALRDKILNNNDL